MKTRAQIPSTANLKILEQEAKAIYIELFESNEIHMKETSLFPSECVTYIIITSTIYLSLR